MTYIYNLEVYVGTQPEGPFKVSNRPVDVVKRLAQPLYGSGRNITADNWFSDISLIDHLKEKKLTYVGTVRKNKRELPPDFVNIKGRSQYDSKFAFSGGKVLVSYVPRKGKNVILVSTLHDDDAIDAETGPQKKPELISFYNKTKSGVDTADQMCGNFNVCRNNKRWPMVIFYLMMNVAGINSLITYLGNDLPPMRRRNFLKQLSHELTFPELQRKSMKKIGMPFSLQARLKRFCPPSAQTDEVEDAEGPQPSKRRRCEPCAAETGTRRLTKYNCIHCQKSICLSHAEYVCQECKNLQHLTFPEVPQSEED